MPDPKFPKFQTPEGYKPPTQAGAKSAVGKGHQVAPRREGESEESYLKRKANWERSYAARGGVKIADMNQGQLNKFAASGGALRSQMITSRLQQRMGKTTPPPSGGGGGGGRPGETPYNDTRTPRGIPPRGEGPGPGGGPRPEPGPRQEGAAAGLSQMPGSTRRRRRQRGQPRVGQRRTY